MSQVLDSILGRVPASWAVLGIDTASRAAERYTTLTDVTLIDTW